MRVNRLHPVQKTKQDGAKSREITPNQPKWNEVNKNSGNPIWLKLLKIIKLTQVYQNIEKWTNIART